MQNRSRFTRFADRIVGRKSVLGEFKNADWAAKPTGDVIESSSEADPLQRRRSEVSTSQLKGQTGSGQSSTVVLKLENQTSISAILSRRRYLPVAVLDLRKSTAATQC